MDPFRHQQSHTSPTGEELDIRIRPDAWSTLGFLGQDESLPEVLDRDHETISGLSLTYDQLADALEQVTVKALERYHAPVSPDKIDEVLAHQTFFPNFYQPDSIPRFDLNNLPDTKTGFLIGHIQVFLVMYKDWQSCPWGCEAYSTSDFMILNRKTGVSVTAPEIMPHFIHTHRFFCGLHSPYRTDPEQLAEVLEIQPVP